MMNIDKLIKNISDQIIEGQLKLGFARETVRLYYPLQSICKIIGAEYENIDFFTDRMNEYIINLDSFALGDIRFGVHQGRVEVSIPPEGVEYIHNNYKPSPFLVELIKLFESNHHLTIEELKELFEAFDKGYHCEKMDENADFDYVLYFDDKSVDEYYYCVKMEMGHTIYHRFTKDDYFEL